MDVWLCGILETHEISITELPTELVSVSIWPEMLARMVYEEADDIHWLDPFTSRKHADRLGSPPGLSPRMLDIGRRMAHVFKTGGPRQSLRLRLLLCEALLDLMETGTDSASRGRVIHGGEYLKICRIMNSVLNSHERCSLEDAAAGAQMATKQFAHAFRKATGMEFTDFERRRRIHGAAGRVVATDEPLKKIAVEWGFSDISHLNRVFTSMYGMPPATYRKMHRRVRLPEEKGRATLGADLESVPPDAKTVYSRREG